MYPFFRNGTVDCMICIQVNPIGYQFDFVLIFFYSSMLWIVGGIFGEHMIDGEGHGRAFAWGLRISVALISSVSNPGQ